MRPPGAFGASLGSRSPQAPPEAGLVAATRRSKATPRPRAGRPATSAAGTTTDQEAQAREAHVQSELRRPHTPVLITLTQRSTSRGR